MEYRTINNNMKGFTKYLSEYAPTLEYHSELNPKIWDDFLIKEDIRLRLIQIADLFREFSKIPKGAIKDILLTGGNANFNYTAFSDLDVHLFTNFDKISGCPNIKILYDFFMDKKALWAHGHKELTIKGYPVELYIQPLTEGLKKEQGVYSLKKNKWIQKPTHVEVTMSSPTLQGKVEFLIKKINDLVSNSSTNAEEIRGLKEQIRKMRNSAIAKGGEFSIENLCFKEIRNQGYLKKLSDYLKTRENSDLSLESLDIS